MKNKKFLFKAASGFIALTLFSGSINSFAVSSDINESAWIYGDSANVYPYSAQQTGVIMYGSSEYATVSNENGVPIYGDIAQVGIHLDNVTEPFQVLEMSIDFNSDYLTYLGHDEDALYGGALKKSTIKTVTQAKSVYTMADPIVKIVSASTGMISDSGIITNLKFFVPQGTPAGCYALELNVKNYGYKSGSTEVTLPHVIKNNAFITVPGCAESTEAINFGQSNDVLQAYIESNNIDTTLDNVDGCSPFDIYWSNYSANPSETIFNINDMAKLELGLRGDANLDGTVDTKDAALISKYQIQSSSATNEIPVINETNDDLAKSLANTNGDISVFGDACIGNIDTKDAANVAKYAIMYATYPQNVDAMTRHTEIWTELNVFDS